MPISIIIFEDNDRLRQSLAYLLQSAEEYEVVGDYHHCGEAASLVRTYNPEVVLMDIDMPGGGQWLLLKKTPPEKLFEAIKEVMEGGAHCQNTGKPDQSVNKSLPPFPHATKGGLTIPGQQANFTGKTTTMRNAKISFLILFTVAILTACKKSNDAAPANTIFGYWSGKYGGATEYPSLPINFLFRKDGTIRVYPNTDTSTGSKAEGTYAILGTTITTKYTYIGSTETYSTSSVVNSKYSFMEGTYGFMTSTTDRGRVFLVKQ